MKYEVEDNKMDMPLGLMYAIAHDTRAMNGFFSLDTQQKNRMIRYIKDSRTGDEAKSRIEEIQGMLHQPDIERKYF